MTYWALETSSNPYRSAQSKTLSDRWAGRSIPVLQFVSIIMLMLSPFNAPLTSAEDSDETVSSHDTVNFSSTGQSVWGPAPGITRRDFRFDVVDIDEVGSTPFVNDLIRKEKAASFRGNMSLVCPAGTFWGGQANNSCYQCDDDYIHDPSRGIGEGECFKVTGYELAQPGGDTQILCASDEFLDVSTGQCFSCPDSSYSHNPAIAFDQPGACFKDVAISDPTFLRPIGCDAGKGEFDGGNGKCYTCPAGYNKPILAVALGGQCYKPPRLLTDTMAYCGKRYWDSCDTKILGICVGGWDHSLGSCRSHRIRKSGSNKYYDCDSGYSHNPLVAFNRKGICYKNVPAQSTSAGFVHNYYCAGNNASFDGRNGNCYSCPNNTQRTPAIPWITPGTCVAGTIAAGSNPEEPSIACPNGEFFDLTTQSCYSCPNGSTHNPAFSAQEPGACYHRDEKDSTYVGNENEFTSCESGEFFVPADECWSCGDYIKNPLVLNPRDANACLTLEAAETGEYKASVKVDYDIEFNWGIDGYVQADGGTVSVDYQAGIDVDVQQVASEPQEIYQIQTTLADETLDWGTTGPSVEMQLDSFLNADSFVSATIKFPYMTDTGQLVQGVEVTETLFDDTTYGEQRVASDPLVLAGIDGNGLGLEILGDVILGGNIIVDRFKDVKMIGFKTTLAEYGFPLLEFGIHVPDINTPADPFYNGNRSGTPDSRIQTVGPGSRLSDTFFGIVASTDQDPDFFRMDLDVDGFYFAIQKIPLGVRIRQKVGPIKLYSLEYNYLDFDSVLIFSFDRKDAFEPRLDVELQFSKPVKLETTEGSNHYELVSKRRVAIGEKLRFIHPGGDVQITPVYSVLRNSFTNDTDLVLTKMLEMEFSSFEFRTLFYRLPKIAAIGGSLDLGPPEEIVNLNFMDWGSNDPTEFSLTNFSDVPGNAITIQGSNEPPVALCQDVTLVLDGKGVAALTPEDLDAGSRDPEGADGLDLLISREEFTCASVGVQEVVLTAVDSAGLSDECTASVSVETQFPLSVDAGDDLNVEATSTAGAAAEIQYMATGGCGEISFGFDPNLATYPIGDTTVTVTVTDESGIAAADSMSITVFDAPPVIDTPVDITAEATAKLTPIDLLAPDASDRVDGPLVAQSDAPPKFPVGTTTVNWWATDSAGNTSTTQSSVIITDTTAPVLTAPSDILGYEATALNSAVIIGIATGTDEVGPVTISSDQPPLFAVGTTIVTWTATDAYGNSALGTQTVEVVDTTPPEITPPDDITAEASAIKTPLALGMASATDIVDASLVATPDITGPFSVDLHTVTWSASDTAGNTGTALQYVRVVDTTPPTLSVPADIHIEAIGPLTPIIIGAAIATDIFDVTVSSDAPDSYPVGTTEIHWLATDYHGNWTRATQIVQVVDTTAPVVTAPADITVVASGLLTNVDLGVALAEDAVGVVAGPSANPPGPFNAGATTVTWRAADGAGNEGTAVQRVRVLGELTCELNRGSGDDKDDDDDDRGKHGDRPESLTLRSYNVDENQAVIWSALFHTDPGLTKKLILPGEQQLTWMAGSLTLAGDIKLKVKALRRSDAAQRITLRIKGKKQSIRLESASGGLNPVLASGALQRIRVNGIDGASLMIDGQAATGSVESLKLRVARNDPTRVVEFSLIINGNSALPVTKNGLTSAVELTVPSTTVSILAGSTFTEHKRHRRDNADGDISAKLKRLYGDGHSKKSTKSGKSKKSNKRKRTSKTDVIPTGIDPNSLLDGNNEALSRRSGACVLDIPANY